MSIDINPALKVYKEMVDSGLYEQDELEQFRNEHELDSASIIVNTSNIEGSKPVHTLVTINDEEMATEFPASLGGPIMTDKRALALEKEREIVAKWEADHGLKK